MSVHCDLLILVLALTLQDQVHTAKIIGGHEAMPHSRPYMVFLEDDKGLHCGGFLLNEDFVMTAAHCQASPCTVLLGVHDSRKSSEIQRISVEQSFPHKDFVEKTYKNDIMLLKLSSKAIFSKNVRPIALADQDDGSLPTSCTVSGWGRLNNTENLTSHVLMEAKVTLIYNKQCVMNNYYCSEGAPGPGKGDSGGPLVCGDGKAYGVVSHKYIPYSGSPPIDRFSKISVYKTWTELTMANA